MEFPIQVRYPLGMMCAFLLGFQLIVPVHAQTRGFLKLTVLEGEGAFNDMKRKVAHPPLVRVVDESDNPVIGAEVTFTFPTIGPGGIVPGGGQILKVKSDEKGTARCPSYLPNIEEGRFLIRVVVRAGDKSGTATVNQSNTSAGGTSIGDPQAKKSKAGLLIAIIGGGAAAGIFAATRGGKSGAAAAQPSTTLSLGSLTVGAPR